MSQETSMAVMPAITKVPMLPVDRTDIRQRLVDTYWSVLNAVDAFVRRPSMHKRRVNCFLCRAWFYGIVVPERFAAIAVFLAMYGVLFPMRVFKTRSRMARRIYGHLRAAVSDQ
jgi:hypothetical protein